MEFHALAATALKGFKVYEGFKLEESFLNVNRQENFGLYNCILIMKCVAVACGMRELPGKTTFMMLLANFIKSSIYEWSFYRILLSISHFVITTFTLFLFHDESLHPLSNAIVLMVACLYEAFEFFIDAYVTVLFFWHIFQVYGNEIEKSFTLISYLYCLDWFTDCLLETNNIGMVHAVLVLHLPVFLLAAIRPLNAQFVHNFIYLVMGVTLWQVCRLAKAGLKRGVTNNRFFILNETLNAIKFPKESVGKMLIYDER